MCIPGGRIWSANSKNKFDEFWVISNTDFTQDSIDFANCSGLKVFGQNHPAEHAVSHMVQNTGIHPVTSLTCLNKIQKKKLLKEGILLVRQIQKKPAILKSLNLSEKSSINFAQKLISWLITGATSEDHLLRGRQNGNGKQVSYRAWGHRLLVDCGLFQGQKI